MGNQAKHVVLSISTGLAASLLFDALNPSIDSFLVDHSLVSWKLFVKLVIVVLLIALVYWLVSFCDSHFMTSQRRAEALSKVALNTVEYLRTRQLTLEDNPPEVDIRGIRAGGLSESLNVVRRRLTPIAAQLKEAIRQAFGFANENVIRTSIFIPRIIGDTPYEDEKGQLALFNGGSSDTDSKSLTDYYYFLPGHGYAGTCWETQQIECGGRYISFFCWQLEKPAWLLRRDERWVNMHQRTKQDHQFRQVACIPVHDRLDESVVVAVISLDSKHASVFPHGNPKLIADAIQVAAMAVADCVRMLYSQQIEMRTTG